MCYTVFETVSAILQKACQDLRKEGYSWLLIVNQFGCMNNAGGMTMTRPGQLDNLPAKRKHGGGAAEKIDLQKALELRLKGVSFQDIANHFKCSKQAVQLRLKPYVAKQDIDTETYKKNRADIFANKQAAVLAALTDGDLKKIVDKSPMAAVTLFNSLFNNERLERGQSTQNTAVLMASAVLAADADVTQGVTIDVIPEGKGPDNR